MQLLDFSPPVNYRKIAEELYFDGLPWQKDIGDFLLKWIDSSDVISTYTSGTTGEPKSILIPKKAMVRSAKITGQYFNFEHKQTMLLALSSNYIAGKMTIIRALVHQMGLYICEPTANPLESLTENIDFAALVPYQLEAIMTSENGLEKLNKVKQILIGGAPIHPKLEAKLESINSSCFASYGMTETISHIAIRALNGVNKSDWFKVLENISIAKDDRNCLTISAPKLNSERLITNDLVEITGATFKIIGRYDHIINSGGIKLNPIIIEQKIEHLLHVPFFIAGIPDEKLGEKVVLILESEQIDEQLLLSQIKAITSPYEIPKRVICLPAFIYTETGKLKRKATLALKNL